jgi:hypothetical protein
LDDDDETDGLGVQEVRTPKHSTEFNLQKMTYRFCLDVCIGGTGIKLGKNAKTTRNLNSEWIPVLLLG